MKCSTLCTLIQFSLTTMISKNLFFSSFFLCFSCLTIGGYTDVNSEGLTTNTWKALYDAGVPGKQVNEAGTIRFGSGMKPKKGDWSGYCHSNARGQVCGRNMIQMHRNPLEWQAAFTLAHELGHSFGMCAIKTGLPWSKYCIPSPGGKYQ